MKDHKEKEWDEFIGKLVKEAGLESPAANFTDKVLLQIEKLESRNPVLVYKPLISNRVWFILVAFLVGLVTFSVFGDMGPVPKWLALIRWDRITMPEVFQSFYQWTVPGSVIYSVLAISCFIFLQVFLVRNSQDKFYKIS